MTPEEIKKAQEDLQKIKEVFSFQSNRFAEFRTLSSKEGKGKYPHEADESLRIQKEKVDAEYKLKRITRILSQHVDKETADRINKRYEDIRKEHEWTAKPLGGIGSATIYSSSDPEVRDTYFSIVFEEIEKNLELLADGKILDEINNIKTPLQKPLEENVDFPYQQQIDTLKSKVQSDEDKRLLDEVNMYLSRRKDDAHDYISNFDFRDKGAAITTNKALLSMTELEGGKFGELDSYFENRVSLDDTEYSIVTKPEVVKSFIDVKPTIDEADKQAIINITNKMKEYGVVNKNSAIEQGGKIYAHETLLNAQVELSNALKTGNIDQIRQAKEKYDIKHNQMRELFKLTKESFPDQTLAPGNVATIRNGAIPAEFSLDYVTDSRVNGLYQLTCFCEKMGITVEQFMDSPAKYTMDYLDKTVAEKAFPKIAQMEGKESFLSSYEALIRRGKNIEDDVVNVEKELVGGDAGFILDRVMDGMSYVMQNQDNILNIQRIKLHTRELVANRVILEDQAQRCLNDVLSNPEKDPALTEMAMTGLKQAFLEGGNIDKKHLPMPYTDSYGIEIPRTSYSSTLNEKNQYAKIIENYNKCAAELASFRADNVEPEDDIKVGEKHPLRVIETAMFEYLMAHPEDSMKPEYKQLEQLALGAEKKLNINHSGMSSTPAQQYKKWKKDYVSEKNELFSEAKNRAKKQNKVINNYQNRLKSISSKKDAKSVEERRDLTRELYEEINQMINNEIEDYTNGKITENYLKERVKNLKDIQKNNRVQPTIPSKFIDTNNPESFEKDASLINQRINKSVKEDHLQSLDSFKKWKLKQKDMELLEEGELSKEEWDLLYNNELQRMRGAGDVPEGVELVDYETFLNNNSIREGWISETGEEVDFGDKKPEKGKSLGACKKELKDFLTNEEMIGKLADPKTPEKERNNLENQLTELLADTITAEIIKRNGSLPNNQNAEEFSRRMRSEPSFRSVTKPVLETVYNDYNKFKNNPEAGFLGPEVMNKMVDTRAFLVAADADQKHFQGMSDDAIKDQISRGVKTPGATQSMAKYNELKKEVAKEMQQSSKNMQKTEVKGMGIH